MELTKEYFDRQLENLAGKEELEQIRDDIRAIKSDMTEVRLVLNNLDKRDKEDSDAFAQTLVNHNDRLMAAENDVKQLKLKQA